MAYTEGDLYVPCWWPFPPSSETPHAGECEHHSPLSIMPSESYVTLHAGLSQSSETDTWWSRESSQAIVKYMVKGQTGREYRRARGRVRPESRFTWASWTE
jgi:hypothetical protein